MCILEGLTSKTWMTHDCVLVYFLSYKISKRNMLSKKQQIQTEEMMNSRDYKTAKQNIIQ